MKLLRGCLIFAPQDRDEPLTKSWCLSAASSTAMASRRACWRRPQMMECVCLSITVRALATSCDNGEPTAQPASPRVHARRRRRGRRLPRWKSHHRPHPRVGRTRDRRAALNLLQNLFDTPRLHTGLSARARRPSSLKSVSASTIGLGFVLNGRCGRSGGLHDLDPRFPFGPQGQHLSEFNVFSTKSRRLDR